MAPVQDLLSAAFRSHHAGLLQDAQQLYRQILEADPNCAEAWHFLGAIRQQAGDLHAARECYSNASLLKPDDASTHNNLGNVLRDLGRFDDAIAAYQRAIELAPSTAEIYNNLGVALRDCQQPDQAIAAFQQALAHRPQYFEALNNLANALKDLGRLDEAVSVYQQAAAREPTSAMVLDNLGLIRLDQGRWDEARACFQRSLEIDPASPHVHWCQSLLMLLVGDFDRGWPEHEWRWRCPDWRRQCQVDIPPADSRPAWDGSPLAGKTILLQAEQGFGDTIQFVRYVQEVKRRGGHVIVQCHQPLVPLLQSSAADSVIGHNDALPAFDVRASLMSLPAIFRTTLSSIPADVPYLAAEPGLIADWRSRLQAIAQPRIGINWRGRPGQGVFRFRDIPLTCFADLAQNLHLTLISLQRGAGRAELQTATGSLPIIDLGDDVDTDHGAFMDTAAIMMNLDLVITSDTAIAHLAGALGVPVWVALPFAPDWRWLLERTDSPWYPTMRLFRQKSPGDWPSVFKEIERALTERPGRI
jgi:tetratricopeptide (TPR) repeat protein